MRDWVLSRVTGQDLDALTDAAQRAAKAAVCYIENGPDKAMNEFNQGK
jgi:PTH1 family peptidyl-tRNA hydrolase